MSPVEYARMIVAQNENHTASQVRLADAFLQQQRTIRRLERLEGRVQEMAGLLGCDPDPVLMIFAIEGLYGDLARARKAIAKARQR